MPSDKTALRRALRARWQNWAGRDTISRAITGHLTGHPLWQDAHTVFLYLGGTDEVSTAALLAAGLHAGKTMALPRCLGGGVMEFRRYEGTLAPDFHDLPAPPESAALTETADLALVPGLAFDRQGFRLGRGGGYYDRFLSGFAGVSLGLCPSAFCADSLCTDPWDMPVSGLVTEHGLSVF